MAYDAERADSRALDQLEAILRGVADELAAWRARALKSEADGGATAGSSGGRGGGSGGGGGGGAGGAGARHEIEVENRALRQRVDAARARVSDLVARLSFLEQQVRGDSGGDGGTGGVRR
ncbi:MAG: hypothetical protein ACREMV_04320 [Gemmatimonadales bacterium]